MLAAFLLALCTLPSADPKPATVNVNLQPYELVTDGIVREVTGLKKLTPELKLAIQKLDAQRTRPRPAPKPVPNVDLRSKAPPVEDQDGQNSCCPHAACHAFRAASLLVGQPDPNSAVSDLYARIDDGVDRGASLADAAYELQQHGVACLQYAPHLGYKNVPEKPGYLEDRATHKAYSVASTLDESQVFKSIADANPVLVGINVTRSFTPDAAGYVAPPRGAPLGGHALCVLGLRSHGASYDYLIQNSWGQNWGQSGFAWIDYRWIAATDYGAFAFSQAKIPPLPKTELPTLDPPPAGCCPGGSCPNGNCSPALFRPIFRR